MTSTSIEKRDPNVSLCDKADEEHEKEAKEGTATCLSEDLNVESLQIDESKKKTVTSLDEPDDSDIKTITSGDSPYTSAITFEDLSLSPELLKALYVVMGFHKPSRIQAITLPMILTPPYKNLIAQAHNGSGKTTCFVLGMLSRVDPNLKAPQALCICPTRELALQNLEVLRKLGRYTVITSEIAVPTDSTYSVPINKRPPVTAQVVIGTPGTIKKWISYKKLSPAYTKILVFDEADHMLAEDGFRDDSLKIMKDIVRANANCQVLLFSATFNHPVRNFVTRTIKDYNQIFVKKGELSLVSVKQYKVYCPDEDAKRLVIRDRIIDLGEEVGQAVIFVRTKSGARRLHGALVDDGWEVTTIHGDLKQEDRDKIVREFKDGVTQILISTDLLSRGFDQQQVNLVINYDLPVKHDNPSVPDYEVYLHRIGRAGRFGRNGAIFNLLCNDEEKALMTKIENHFASVTVEVPSWNSDEDFKKALKGARLL